MKKSTSIILGLLLVLVLVTASGAQGTAVANESEHATPTVTEEVTPTDTEVTPTEEHPTEECTPTPTEVTPTPTEEVTPTPTEEHHEETTPTPTAVPVLGVTTMAKAGSFDQTLMNLSGISGMLFTLAGSLIYAKKRNN
jgi:hypothetical protein